MPIEIACPKCHRRMRAPDSSAGRKVKCLVCQEPIDVPGGEVPQPPQPVADKKPAGKPAPKPTASTASAPKLKVAKPLSPQSPSAKPSAPATPGKTTSRPAKDEKWTLMTEDDQEFGPVPRAELDSWFAEGLITAKCQVLREGGTEWQFAPELYPSLKPQNSASSAAASKPTKPTKPTKPVSPFGDLEPIEDLSPLDVQQMTPLRTSAPAALTLPANPYAAPTMAWGPPQCTAFAGWAGALCIATGAGYVVRSLMYLVLRATAISYVAPSQPRGVAMALGTIMGIVFLVLALALAIPYVLAGVGILRRKSWGRVTGIVCAVISCLFALFFLLVLGNSVLNFIRILQLPIPLGPRFFGRVAAGLLVEVVFLATLVTQAVMTFMLLRARHSREFR